jgi:hypothetical protein
MKHFEVHFLEGARNFVGGAEISVADLQFASEIIQVLIVFFCDVFFFFL